MTEDEAREKVKNILPDHTIGKNVMESMVKIYESAHAEGVMEERERAARIAEDVYNLPTGVIIETHGFSSDVGQEIAKAIRKEIK